MRFRSVNADANVLFEVTAQEGQDSWRAVAVNEPIELEGGSIIDSDFAGEERVFTPEQVLRSAGLEAFFARAQQQERAALAALTAGVTVHLRKGRDQWMRGTLVDVDGLLRLRPEALIGVGWRDYELTGTIANDASIVYRYDAKQIISGEPIPFRADAIWESEAFRREGADEDPAQLPARPIVTPQITDEHRQLAALDALLDEARSAAFGADARSLSPQARLRAAQAVLARL